MTGKKTTPRVPDSKTGMSGPGEFIRRNQHTILNQWIDAMLRAIPQASQQSRAELANHLASQLDELVEVLTSIDGDVTPEALYHRYVDYQPATEHGRERATLRNWSVGQLAHEYVILRQVITGLCDDDRPLSDRDREIIINVIEYALLSAVNEFSRSVLAVQQKLIGTLVHDVRTPLSVVGMYMSLLGLPQISDQEKTEIIDTVGRNLTRCTGMLEAMLDTIKGQAGQGLLMHFEEVDLNDALQSVCKEADQIYKQQLIADLAERPVIGVFDLALIIRTIENLISNAIKFGDKHQPVKISVIDNDDHVIVQVQNQGQLIPLQDQERIFDFFASLATEPGRQPKGWGLGLALIKTVASHHGGSVIFESTVEAGTVFGMTLNKSHRQQGDEVTVLL